MINVLIVADQETIRVVEGSLGSEPGMVFNSTSDGSNVQNLLKSDAPPKIAFVNCSLVDNENMDLCKRIKDFREESYTHLILLSDEGVQELVKYLDKGNHELSSAQIVDKELGNKKNNQQNFHDMCTQAAPVPSETGEHLTKKQCEVLQLLSRGFSNHEIALRLDITTGTVKSHMNHILGKLGAVNRTQALAKAAKSGLVSLHD